jgi:WD40 repeat protein
MTNDKIKNDRSLQQLAWAIEASGGQFKLILARCNYTKLRDRLLEQLKEICRVEISILAIQESNRTLYSAIREEFGEKVPACVMVVGLESVQDLAQMLTSANQVREEFRKHFPFPLVLWINDDIHKQLMQIAPDLESWAVTRNFAIAKQDLVNFIQKTADQWFNNTLTLNLEEYHSIETELAAAQRDLLDDHNFNTLEIRANFASLFGFVKQVSNQINSAIENYQIALALWQQSYNLERQVKILGNLAFCYYHKACKQTDINHPDWQKTRHYLQEYIDLLAQSQNPQLIADSILQLGNILRDVGIWQQFQNLAEQLKSFAQQALALHQANNQLQELARDYGFLAEVALVQKSWDEANELIQQALRIWSAIPSSKSGLFSEIPEKFIAASDFRLCQFILGLSQYHLGQTQEAIISLEIAKNIGNPLKDIKLYLNILSYLQRLYFEQQEYLKAYEMKQQQRSVEQQFGLRAFIGAGRLGATKQAIEETVQVTSLQENIAPEIAASGRQLDVERLIERIGRPDYKLIVIHGQSGVGKSSLINAGLVPALKNKAIGIQDNLPVVMRFYNNWEEELERVMLEALRESRGEEAGVAGGERRVESFISEVQGLASEYDTPSSELQTSTSKHDTPSSELQASTSEHDTPSSQHQASTSEHQTPSLEHQASTSEHQTPSSEHQASTSEHDNSNFLLNTPSLELQTPHSFTSPSPPAPPASSSLLSQLRDNEQKNLRTVLIFDQFEEFFFAYPEPAQRRRFFEFLGECFNVLSVKVILSLRLDYLHYLLECNDLPNMQIIGNDILSKNVLYKLGNFSTTDAKSIIQRLTENSSFRLEPALIDQLVQDLAGELDEVRPIELQVIGAQLQTENITTLAEYRRRGTKEQLVKHYLNEVVHDCGVDNQQLADLLLYLLTNEKGTRPLRTLAELERDLQALVKEDNRTRNQTYQGFWLKRRKKTDNKTLLLSAKSSLRQKLKLVLEIFVKSGLVVLLKENPAERYQLVHDYIAAFIRQQQEPKLKELMTELENEREQRKLGEEKLNRLLKRALLGSVAAGLVLAVLTALTGIWAQEAERQKKQAAVNEIQALTNSSEALFLSDLNFDALSEGLKAGGKLRDAETTPDNRMQTIAALWQAVYLQPNQYKFKERNTLNGHNGIIYSVSFSPDGRRLATASDDSTVKLWDINGKLLRTFKGHTGIIYGVSFSPNGRLVASASNDNTVKIWDINGKLLQTLKGHSDAVNAVSFSPNGRLIASASDDNTVKLWDINGKLLQTLKGHSDAVNSVSFSPDGKTIATTSSDKTVKLWHINGKLLQTLKGHTGAVNGVSFSPDGKTIATASSDKTVKLWHINGKLLQTLKEHTGAVNGVSFSPDGRRLASASSDSTVKLWHINGKLLQTLKGHSGYVNDVSFSPNGRLIASVSLDSTVKLWDINGKPLQILKAHSESVNSVSFSPDGRLLASASSDSTIKLWDTNAKLLQTLNGHSASVNSISFSPDGGLLASGSDDNTIKLWDINGKLLQTLKGHTGTIYGVSFSPDGRLLASASYDTTVKIWETNGKLLQTLKENSGIIYSVSFSPDSKTIATANFDSTVKLWDINGKLLQTFKGHGGTVNNVSFSPDGRMLASASDDSTVKLWDINGKLLQTLKGHSGIIYGVNFSPDGKTIVTASSDSTVKLWGINGKLLKTLMGHSGIIYGVSFSPDSKTIATASSDSSVILWDFNLDNLLESGCHQLNNYLAIHPHVLEELKACQTPAIRREAAPTLVAQGEELARKEDIVLAVAKFRKALEWDSSLNFDPKAKAQQLANASIQASTQVENGEKLAKIGNLEDAVSAFNKALQLDSSLDFQPKVKAASVLVQEGESLVRENKFQQALAAYTKAQNFEPTVEIPADSWKTLCRQGTLQKQAADVIFACDQAVKLASKDGSIRDIRGLARALTGNIQGAIADFEAYITWTDDPESKSQRQRWVKELRAGKNPLTDDELNNLR